MSDVDTATVDSLKALDPNRPIREGDIAGYSITSSARATSVGGTVRPSVLGGLEINRKRVFGRRLAPAAPALACNAVTTPG